MIQLMHKGDDQRVEKILRELEVTKNQLNDKDTEIRRLTTEIQTKETMI